MKFSTHLAQLIAQALQQNVNPHELIACLEIHKADLCRLVIEATLAQHQPPQEQPQIIVPGN